VVVNVCSSYLLLSQTKTLGVLVSTAMRSNFACHHRSADHRHGQATKIVFLFSVAHNNRVSEGSSFISRSEWRQRRAFFLPLEHGQ
jgi:hypothetical protein